MFTAGCGARADPRRHAGRSCRILFEQPLQAQGVFGQLLPRDAGGDRVRKAGGEATGLQCPGEAVAPPSASRSQMPRNGTGPSSLSITERRLGRCSVQTHVVSMVRPRKRRVSVTSTPGRSGPRRWGRTAIRLICQRGRLVGLCQEREDLLDRAVDLLGVFEERHRRAELRPGTSRNRYGARGGAGRRNAAGSPAGRAGRRDRGVRHPQGGRAAGGPGARRPPAAARRAGRAAVAGARRRARARRAAADAVGAALRGRRRLRGRDARQRLRWCAAPGCGSTSTCSGPPRSRAGRATRPRCSAATSSRASACATRPRSRTGSAPRPTGCGASWRWCWRGWSRSRATWRWRAAGSSSTRCTSRRTGR